MNQFRYNDAYESVSALECCSNFFQYFFLLKYPKYMYLIERSLSCLLFTIISSIVYLLKAPNTYQDHEISILVRFSSKQVIPSYHKYSHCFRPKTKRAPLCCDNPSAILGSGTLSNCLISLLYPEILQLTLSHRHSFGLSHLLASFFLDLHFQSHCTELRKPEYVFHVLFLYQGVMQDKVL